MFGICNLSIIPLRLESNDRSEIVSQILFGEHFIIIEKNKQWSKVKLHYDNYEGWIDSKQYQTISIENYEMLCEEAIILNGDLVEFINVPGNEAIEKKT